ncbi:MAG: DUF2520 domain-containing protein [Sediminibacterium sp.]
MQVVIIGSGNVATVLGRLLVHKGHQITQVWSRQESHAVLLAAELAANPITDLTAVTHRADLYLLAVADDAMEAVTATLRLKDQLVLHTAGAVSKEILSKVSTKYGVLWPMKMIRKSMNTLEPVTMVVDGNTEEVVRQVEKLALEYSPNVARAGDAARVKMHLLAAITSNFTNHIYHLAADYCKAEGISFDLFYPIIHETAQQIQQAYPGDVQAGPAFRGDQQTVQKHEQLLNHFPALHKVYCIMTESIRQKFGVR